MLALGVPEPETLNSGFHLRVPYPYMGCMRVTWVVI